MQLVRNRYGHRYKCILVTWWWWGWDKNVISIEYGYEDEWRWILSL